MHAARAQASTAVLNKAHRVPGADSMTSHETSENSTSSKCASYSMKLKARQGKSVVVC